MKIVFVRIVFFVLIVLLWYLVIWAWNIPPQILPDPKAVLQNFVHGFTEGNYFLALLYSLARVGVGYVIALVIGVVTGILLGRYTILDITFGRTLLSLQSIPSVAWVPLALLWFGVTDNAVIFIIVLEAVLPTALSTKTAMRNIPTNLIRAAQTLGSRSYHLYRNVIIKAMIPELVTGLRLSFAFAWRALIAGELFIHGVGIGQNLELGREYGDMAQVIAMITTIGLIGFFTENVFFANVEKKVRKAWGYG